MTLKHNIVHRIEREVAGADINTQLRERENSAIGTSFSLFEQLKQSFLRSGLKQYGTFNSQQSDNPLPGWIKDHFAEKSSFASFSHRLMAQLQQAMESHQEAFSAHILLATETVLDQRLLYLFWINHVDASQIDSDLEVSTARYIDTGKLQFAARLFVDEWLEGSTPKCLTMIASRGNKILTDAFSHFLGFSTGLDLVEETHEFLDIVDQYVETLPEEKNQEVKGKILDYCIEQDKWGSPVNFEEISSQLNDAAPRDFSNFVTEQQQQPKAEIYTDRNSLKRYVRFFGRDNNMSISFSSDLYGQDVIYNESEGSLTIKRIPKSLKQQLSNQKHNRNSAE